MTDQPPPVAGAVRLIFEYEGDTVRLVSQEPVDTVATTPIAAEQRAGHFVETRNDAGDLLARVPVRTGMDQSAEVFPEDHEAPITRVDTEARGAFTVVVPAQADAAQVAVVRIPPARIAAPRPGRFTPPIRGAAEHVELGSFQLRRQG
jgi:hypothetical protein